MQTKRHFFIGLFSGISLTFIVITLMGFNNPQKNQPEVSIDKYGKVQISLSEEDINKISARVVNLIVERVLFCIDGSKINLEDEDGNDITGKLRTYCNN